VRRLQTETSRRNKVRDGGGDSTEAGFRLDGDGDGDDEEEKDEEVAEYDLGRGGQGV
jgi:hypothetical protein